MKENLCWFLRLYILFWSKKIGLENCRGTGKRRYAGLWCQIGRVTENGISRGTCSSQWFDEDYGGICILYEFSNLKEKKIDYQKEFDSELDRVNQRATILNDMLNHQSGQEKFLEDGTLMVAYKYN